jgi:hypothetical protein
VIVEQAHVGARGVDSLPFSQGGTAAQALALKAVGVDFFVGYLGAINAARLGYLLDAGIAFMAVTFGGRFDGDAAVAQCHALNLPAGVTVWLDVEGQGAFNTPVGELANKINAWADKVAAAGYIPGLYVGVPQPLSSAQLWALHVQRYWRGQGSIRDHANQLAEPTGGWCMTQMWPSAQCGGTLVDFNIVGADYRGRVPAWLRSA